MKRGNVKYGQHQEVIVYTGPHLERAVCGHAESKYYLYDIVNNGAGRSGSSGTEEGRAEAIAT